MIMKKIIMSFVALCFLSLSFVFASENSNPIPVNKKSNVSKILKEMIKYPSFALENNIEGCVHVSFKINNDGQIVIEKTNFLNEELRDYVLKELKEITFSPSDFLIDQTLNIKFSFVLL